MKQFSFCCYLVVVSLLAFDSLAQGYYPDEDSKAPLQPTLSFGTGSYLFQGDIQGPKKNILMGNQGYSFGLSMNISDQLDMSCLLSTGGLHEKNDADITSFSSDLSTVGLGIKYNFHQIAKQSKLTPFLSCATEIINFRTNNQSKRTTLAVPFGLGIMMDISERIELDMGFNYHYTFSDALDGTENGGSDKFMVTNFIVHYDIFTPKPRKAKPYSDQSYYVDVNFKAMDIEDEDGDLVVDINDYCPRTPHGVKVDENGCPTDDDKDGIPNYIDEEPNTPRGAIVNEKGVQLSSEQAKSMYDLTEAASREYANVYNENEISKDNFKTINEYLLAKANAFNMAHDITNSDKNVGKRFVVQLGVYQNEVPANEINRFLSYEDLSSITNDDGTVVYTVGSYATFDEAINRQSKVEMNEGLQNTEIVIVENGMITPVTPEPLPEEPVVQEEIKSEVVQVDSLSASATDSTVSVKEEEELNSVGKIVFRVQIGAYKEKLSSDIFKGVPNVVSFASNDGLTRYFAGSFENYSDAVHHQLSMIERGFEDALVVSFKDGNYLGLYSAIEQSSKKQNTVKSDKTRKNKSEVQNPDINVNEESEEESSENETKPNVEYIVQVGIFKEDISSEVLKKLEAVGNINRVLVDNSKVYRYFAGKYSDYSQAEGRLAEVKKAGFSDAFIRATSDGKTITLEQARKLTE